MKASLLSITILIAICLMFFYKLFLGQVPFPGDLLVNSEPYKSQGFLGYTPGGYPNKAQGSDVIHQLYPWKYFTIQEMKKGNLPFWNPHNFSGNPMMQNFQSGIFYPLNIIYFLFDFNTAWSLLIISQPILAGVFMYLFLRRLKISSLSSIIGGIAFAFSSYMTVWMEYGNIGSTLLWLPAILLLIHTVIHENRLIHILLGVAVLTCAFFAGYIQGVFYIYVLAAAYAVFLLFQNKTKDFKTLLSLFILFAVPVFLSLPQILPTLELFHQSTRGSYSLAKIEELLNPWFYWVTIFAPDFFGNPASRNFVLPITYIERVMSFGVPLILFVMIAIRHVKDSGKTFFLIFGSIILILGTNFPLVKYFYLIPIPMITTTVPTRIFSLAIFCMIVVSVFGLDYVFSKKHAVSKKLPLLYISLFILLWMFVLIFPLLFPQLANNFSIAKRNLILPTMLAAGTVCIMFLRHQLKQLAIVGILLLVCSELFFSFHKITPFSHRELLYPKTPVISYLQQHAGIHRFWGYGDAYIPSNFQAIDGTYSPEGNDPLHIQTYGLLLASTENGSIPHILPRPDANIAAGYAITDLVHNAYRQKILNLLGVAYVLNKETVHAFSPDTKTFPSHIYELVWHDKQWQIYKNKQALPRYFLTTNFLVEKSTTEAMKKIYGDIDLRKTLILSDKPEFLPDKDAKGNVSLLTYEPNQVVFRTRASGNTVLFFSDVMYPEWQATIDGKVVSILTADIAFRAVSIPKGEHTVRFFYNPQAFVTGLYFSAIGIILLVVFSIKHKGNDE